MVAFFALAFMALTFRRGTPPTGGPRNFDDRLDEGKAREGDPADAAEGRAASSGTVGMRAETHVEPHVRAGIRQEVRAMGPTKQPSTVPGADPRIRVGLRQEPQTLAKTNVVALASGRIEDGPVDADRPEEFREKLMAKNPT